MATYCDYGNTGEIGGIPLKSKGEGLSLLLNLIRQQPLASICEDSLPYKKKSDGLPYKRNGRLLYEGNFQRISQWFRIETDDKVIIRLLDATIAANRARTTA